MAFLHRTNSIQPLPATGAESICHLIVAIGLSEAHQLCCVLTNRGTFNRHIPSSGGTATAVPMNIHYRRSLHGDVHAKHHPALQNYYHQYS